ncbi:MAG: hypothetical protein P8N02_15870, partial [Actinomycetota bacterium]|nr:hypothetical protein [Actinomycetota bacterium]
VLDRGVGRALRHADPTRPTINHSGVPPHPPRFEGTDSHLYFGCQHGEVADLAELARRVPRTVRFVSEFGAQALLRDDGIAAACGAEHYPDIDLERLANQYGAQLDLLARHTPLEAHGDWESWVDATQAYQATVIRHTTEILRTLKYRPTGGYCQFLLNDAMAFVSPSVLDHRRRPKPGWQAMVAANRPVIVVADLHRPTIPSGTTRCALHVVSDLRTTIEGATVDITWEAPGIEARRWRHSGRFDADTVTRVARIGLVAPEPGPAELSIRFEAPGHLVTTSYPVTVV